MTALTWEVPEPGEVLDVVLDDGTVTILRRYGNPSGPRVVLSHGNGLAIDTYFPFWSRLIDDFDVIVYDTRNHGWNEVGPIENHTMPTFIRDHDLIMSAIDDGLGREPKVGVFHSISGLVSLLSPTKGSAFAGLVLLDPPLCKPGRSYEDFDAAAQRMAAAARSRTDRFRSTGDFAELMAFSPLYRHVVPGVLDLMARTTLRRDESGKAYRLRCPPEYEARIIDYASSYSVLVDFGGLVCPVKVIGADPLVPFSYLPTLDLSDIMSVDYDFLPDATHFLPLEQPETCVAILADFIDSARTG